ncbi:acetate--CoA ligase family protein [Patescibacteria group bacterium]|nr:acetate--CoA ligase family protein [Patescibacteria group bacterium]
MLNLDSMFYPKSIALVGASPDEKKLGSIVLKNIIDSGFNGEIFPLNLTATSILGLDTYKDYEDLPSIPDLALIAIPAEFVLDVLEKIIQKGTKNVVIFSAGFKEAGSEGLALEQKLSEIIKKNSTDDATKINVLGPNCLGFVNNLFPLNVTFSQPVNKKGNLRFISQSGAIASSVFDWAEYNEVGFSEFITLGNKTDLNENNILQYFYENDISSLTQEEGSSGLVPIGMYLESIIDGKEFINISKKISAKNPLFLLKPGKSSESKKAMQSHTGSIAGEDYVLDVALKKAGIIRCDGIEDFFDLAKVFAWEKIPKGKNIAIISNAGGPAVLSSDFVAEEGLQLVRFDDETRNELETHLPRAASILNPVDVLGDALAERYESAIKTLIVDDDVHSLLIILTPQVMTQIEKTAEMIGRLSFEYGKPIICSFMGGSHIAKGEKVLNKFKIPSFRYPERAVKAIAKMCQWGEYRNAINTNSETQTLESESDFFEQKQNQGSDSAEIISSILTTDRKNLDSFEANQILEAYGINTPSTKKCESIDNAKSFVQENNFPVVLKISSPQMLHKSDEGGVIAGIDNNEKLDESFDRLKKIIDGMGDSSINAIQIQKQVTKGLELIIGSKKDLVFGNVLMFGAGGVLANLIEDRNLGLIPLNKVEVITLIKNSKVNKLIEGYRGEKGFESEKLVDLILKFQKMINSNPEISEADINPVILNDDGIWAVDGKMILI